MGLFSKFIKDPNEKYLESLQPIIDQINSLELNFKDVHQDELIAQTRKFQEDLRTKKTTLDDILPEAFAMVREVAQRTLKQRHYDVQLLAGIILHQGRIAEMRTGEGKTLSSTLPIYLNALTGQGVHLITVNDYLSKRDAVWMGQIYSYLGLSVAAIEHEASYLYDDSNIEKTDGIIDNVGVEEDYLRPVTRKEAYQADITYGTNNEFGFDYLRDNMQQSLEAISQRGHHFCIIDEVDSVLIDEARTPLIISSPDVESTDKYQTFAQTVKGLKENKDYNIDEKMRSVTFTEEGQEVIAQKLGEDPWEKADFNTIFHLEASLKADSDLLFKKDKDYIVKEGEVIIVDEFTGRLMPGRRYSEGLHQAIEAKEKVNVQRESLTLATVTFQNYFRMYEKLAGMTGTASTEAEEFAKIYNLEVNIIPTNRPIARQDLNDKIYKSEKGKFDAIVQDVKERYEKGQPVLIGTISIEKNELLGELLKREGITCNLLNAKQHEKEAEIIAQAGRVGAVTVATNMAGRGVDIILGGHPFNLEENEKVKALGGVHVLGTSRHESRRIDNQLRGRSGRQGDPGSSQFYISMEDDLMRIFGSDRIKSIMNTLGLPEDMPIENKLITKSVEKSQVRVEGYNFDMRKHLVEYDDIVNKQRELIYKKRKDILKLAEGQKIKDYDNLTQYVLELINNEISEVVSFHTASENGTVWNIKEIFETMRTVFPLSDKEIKKAEDFENFQKGVKLSEAEVRTEIIEYFFGLAQEKYKELEYRLKSIQELNSDENIITQVEKTVLLKTIDNLWIEHLDNISHLRTGIGLRAYAQADPLVVYKKESYDLFVELLNNIQNQVVYSIYKVGPVASSVTNSQRSVITNDPTQTGSKQFSNTSGDFVSQSMAQASKTETHNKTVLKNEETEKFGHKVGRNDPCPCGAKKEDGTPIKYKNCCGK
jgi:preprotein translocase subunit SecA